MKKFYNSNKVSSYNNKKSEDVLINDLYHFIFDYGIAINKKGNKVVNNKYIYIHNYAVLINLSFFKNDITLYQRLMKFSIRKRSEILRVAIERTIANNLNYKTPVDLKGIKFLINNDIAKTI